MKFIKGKDRAQIHLFPVSLDLAIDHDNEVRLIDLFVDSMAINLRISLPLVNSLFHSAFKNLT